MYLVTLSDGEQYVFTTKESLDAWLGDVTKREQYTDVKEE